MENTELMDQIQEQDNNMAFEQLVINYQTGDVYLLWKRTAQGSVAPAHRAAFINGEDESILDIEFFPNETTSVIPKDIKKIIRDVLSKPELIKIRDERRAKIEVEAEAARQETIAAEEAQKAADEKKKEEFKAAVAEAVAEITGR